MGEVEVGGLSSGEAARRLLADGLNLVPGDTRVGPIAVMVRVLREPMLLLLATAGAVVGIYGITRGEWGEALLAGIAAAMSLLPEEFPVVRYLREGR